MIYLSGELFRHRDLGGVLDENYSTTCLVKRIPAKSSGVILHSQPDFLTSDLIVSSLVQPASHGSMECVLVREANSSSVRAHLALASRQASIRRCEVCFGDR